MRWSMVGSAIVFGALFFGMPGTAQAQYTIDSSVVAGGGVGFVAVGSYSLGATIGQAEATGTISGGSYALTGGFWSAVGPTTPVTLLSIEVE